MTQQERKFHESRRKEFAKLIGKDSIAIIFGSTQLNKSYDGDFTFKQFKNFFYLTGFTEPNAALVIAPGGIKINVDGKAKSVQEVLYVRKKDPLMETWNGKRLGYEKVKSELGIECGKVNEDLSEVLGGRMIRSYRKVYINFGEMLNLTDEMKGIMNAFVNNLNVTAANSEIIDASFLLGKMRSVKTQFEIEEMKKAAEITINSYNETMKMIKPGVSECQVQASLEYYYRLRGGESAYYPIVAGGENGCILHYENNNMLLKNEQLVLIDSGAEYNYYCSDITRTFPVNGKFTKEQKLIYNIVLTSNKECIKKMKPGTKNSEMRAMSDKILERELRAAGILKKKSDIKNYSLHGVAHHIGLDTHDAVTSLNSSDGDYDSMRPGNVLTIEPGLYFPKGSKEIDKKFWGIAVRIEDDILITKNGCENLTAKMIKEVDEIEAAMSK